MREEITAYYMRTGLKSTFGNCPHCAAPLPKVMPHGSTKIVLTSKDKDKAPKSQGRKRRASTAFENKEASVDATVRGGGGGDDGNVSDSGVSAAPSDRTRDSVGSRAESGYASATPDGGGSALTSFAGGGYEILTPMRMKQHFRRIWSHSQYILQAIFPTLATIKSEFPTDIFFLECVLVTPPRFRPVSAPCRMTSCMITGHSRRVTLPGWRDDHPLHLSSIVTFRQTPSPCHRDVLNYGQP